MSQKAALILFVTLVVLSIALATWWIVFMAQLTDEKVDIAIQLGATPEFVEQLHQQEIERQIMLGSEGVFLLALLLFGVWMIYRSLARIEQVKRQQQNFLMAVTHELKTPLASMQVYLDTLESHKIPDDKKATVIPRLKQDVVPLSNLVDNVLDAGRFERSDLKIERDRLNFGALVKEIASEYQRDFTETKSPGRFEIVINTISELDVAGDAHLLQRAIKAVLDNAWKYCDKSDRRIEVRVAVDGSDAVFTVSDNGAGIAPDDIGRVFDRFYRAGSELTRTTPGTGLGLYLCREIVKLHKGRVSVRSDGIGRGATFEIRIPLADKR